MLDKIVHLEKALYTKIPETFRWCDSLRLEKHRMNVGDCELYVEEEGNGVPLVLINGGPGGTHHLFHPWFQRAAKFARVIYYDQRGCGLSDFTPGKGDYSVDQAVEDLDAIRKGLKIDRWVVLGYSYGGFLAQYYATRYPENISGLILLGAEPGMWIDMKGSRQSDFLSTEEKAKMKEIRVGLDSSWKINNWPSDTYEACLVYNNFLNGDWKRQCFYKPSPDEIAQGALYEWNYDQKNNFRGKISYSKEKIDLTEAFQHCPIPTLILEGRWDLTWNTDKPEILHKNHPGSKLLIVENAGHGIYDEAPEQFFDALNDFLKKLQKISRKKIDAYKNHRAERDRKQKTSVQYILRSSGYGRTSNKQIAKAFKKEWLKESLDLGLVLKTGFALYDVGRYADALWVFEKMEEAAVGTGDIEEKAFALIWQGQMLDLLAKRSEAIERYKKVVELSLSEDAGARHDQFGLSYEYKPYARERMEKPFVRIENKERD